MFNIQLAHPFCKSNAKSDPSKSLESRERIKKTKHIKRCREHNLNFASCIATTNLILGEEFTRVVKNIIQRLEQKWQKRCSIIKNNVKFRISLAIIRGVFRCITGITTKIEGYSFQSKDGEDIELLLC